jgi:uncharacterized protein YkwD
MAVSYKPYLLPLALLIALTGAPAAAKRKAVRLDAFSQALLDAHNQERTRLGMAALVWNDRLAADAAVWSANLARRQTLEHAGDAKGQGENLWSGTSGASSPVEMIGTFLAEAKDFRPGKFPDVSRSGDLAHVGHYTQVIWRSTRELGCAKAAGGGDDYLVCRYRPAGNVDGQRVP